MKNERFIINLQEQLDELIEDASDDEQLASDKNANQLNVLDEEKHSTQICNKVIEVEKPPSPICNGTVEDNEIPTTSNNESLNKSTTNIVTSPIATETVQKLTKQKTPPSKKPTKQTTSQSKKPATTSISLQPLRKSIRRTDDLSTDEDARSPSKVRVLSTRNANKKDLQMNTSQVSV